EKSRIVDLSRGESFGYLGFDFREKALLAFDAATACWVWNIARVEQEQISDNVVVPVDSGCGAPVFAGTGAQRTDCPASSRSRAPQAAQLQPRRFATCRRSAGPRSRARARRAQCACTAPARAQARRSTTAADGRRGLHCPGRRLSSAGRRDRDPTSIRRLG